MTKRPGVVITGGDFQGLGAVRTFAKKNIPVIVLDNDHCVSQYTRYKKKFFRSPSPANHEIYFNYLIDLAKREKISGWIIFPNSDETVYILSKYKEPLEEYYRVTTPSWEVIEKIYVKENTYKIAEEHQIPIPQTYFNKSLTELLDSDLPFPLVIKPSIRDNFYRNVKTKAYRVNNKEELIKIYNYVSSVIDSREILVQEFVPGGPSYLFSYCPFFKDGSAITGIMGRRKRQHPMDFGHASTFVELVNIPEMKETAEKFLKIIGYYGIGEVEFMEDPRNNTYKLLEVNPRIWGWHTLAIASGVDLPYLLYLDMLGEKIDVPIPLERMKWVRLTTDIPTVFKEIMKGNMSVRDYVTSMKGKKEFALFSFQDPLPFFAEILMIPYLWLKRGF
ncbi:MAG: ATP-grasp domain-containing protein [Calditrichaceae bacterium]|nr:ATP-grasp domain-containing protein [Calditrichia bacterium]NUQ43358.1 ATP-grasp domain-containing protein [Calditrichaceae bacterium]